MITIDDEDYVGDNSLTLRLYARMLCAFMNKNKLESKIYTFEIKNCNKKQRNYRQKTLFC